MRLSRFVVALVPVSLLVPGLAVGEPKECISSYESSQELRVEGKLREVRPALKRCQQSDCSRAIRKDCSTWAAEVDRSIPSLSVTVVDASGSEIKGARLLLDGAPAALEGGVIEVNPGAHVVRAESEGKVASEERVTAVLNGKKQAVKIRLASVPTAASSSSEPAAVSADVPRRKVPTATWVAAGVAGVGFLAGAYFFSSARSGEDDLKGRGCAPGCPASDVDVVRRDRLLTYVGLGVGVGALGAAAAFYFLRPRPPESARWGPQLDVAAGPSAVVGSLTWGLQ